MTDTRSKAPERQDRRGTPTGRGTVIGAGDGDGGRIGNPPFVATDEQRQRVRHLAKSFPITSQEQIACMMGFSVDTLTRHFKADLMLGETEMLAAVGAQVVNRALDANAKGPDGLLLAKGDFDAQRFVLARRGRRWSSKIEHSGPDGGPIATVDLSRLNDKQLEDYGRLAAIAAGVDPDSIIFESIEPDP